MDPEKMQRAYELFHELAELPEAERQKALHARCADDEELLRHVVSLLAQQQTLKTDARKPEAATAEEWIGPYRILENLGTGGMGIVYLAEQTQPIRRRVAIKLIKLGMDSQRVLARFEAERQALALLSHPNVAKVFDAGVAGDGRPYFVMEAVPGEEITDYCDRHRLSVTERLGLFIQACEAIQHAHQKGIIHRDIKPSNILVTIEGERPVLKVIDFGVAKATGQELTERTLYTEQGQLIGTPEYMSPEQAEMTGVGIDTRTDIYALGVLLYELLTGTLPLDARELRATAYPEMCRKIREQDPPRPSTRLSDRETPSSGAHEAGPAEGESSDTNADVIARQRATNAVALRRKLRGDLDWITMKALEKDRTRRYATASELAQDVRRHLDHEPVTAGPPSATYRVRKFGRRHRGVLTATAVILILLIVGAIASIAGWRQAVERRRIVETATTSLIEMIRKGLRQGDIDAVAERAAAAGLDLELSRTDDGLRFFVSIPKGEEVPQFAAYTEQVFLWLTESRGEAEAARAEADQSARSESELRVRAEAEAAKARRVQAFLQRMLTSLEPGETAGYDVEFLHRVFEDAARHIDVELVDEPDVAAEVRVTLGRALIDLGLQREGEAQLEKALEYRRQLAREDVLLAECLSAYGDLRLQQSRPREAESFAAEALRIFRSRLGADHQRTLEQLVDLGWPVSEQGRRADAESIFREALTGARRLRDGQHFVATALWSLGYAIDAQGRSAEAEPYVREALEIERALSGPDHPRVGKNLARVGWIVLGQGRHAEAEDLFRRSMKFFADDEITATADPARGLARSLVEQGRFLEAEPIYDWILDSYRSYLPANHRVIASAEREWGRCLTGLRRFEEAEETLLRSCHWWRTNRGDGDLYTQLVMSRLVELYEAWGKPDKAAEWRAKLAEIQAASAGP